MDNQMLNKGILLFVYLVFNFFLLTLICHHIVYACVFVFTMDRAVCVWCNTGSGSMDKWMHSGIFIVPPSRSAIITSNW